MLSTLCSRKWFQGLCIAVVFSLISSEIVAPLAIAQEQGSGPRRLALFFIPKGKADESATLLVKGLFRTLADKLWSVGIERAENTLIDAAALSAVQAKVDEGRKALSASQWNEALAQFTAAEEALKPILSLADRALVARVYKGMGIALASLNRLEDAKRAVFRSLAVYPNQDSSAYAYSLEARNLFSELLREVPELPNGSIEVVSGQQRAEVYVDYDFRGFTPVRVSGLPAGDHLVVAFLEGHMPYASFVTVSAGSEKKVEVTFTPVAMAQAIRANVEVAARSLDKGRALDDAAQGLMTATGATDVLFVQVAERKDAYVLSGFYNNRGQVRQVAVELKRDATLVQSAQAFFFGTLGLGPVAEAVLPPLDQAIAAAPAPAQFTGVAGEGEEYIIDPKSPIFKDTVKKPEETGILKKWWFWTAVGAVVGGAAAIGVVLGRGGGESATPEGRIKIILNRPQ